MWLTSTIPTPPRTTLCSAIRPPLDGYSTGISQPPKLTIFAPSFRCSAFSGVLRGSVCVEDVTESIPLARAEIHGSTRYKTRQRSSQSDSVPCRRALYSLDYACRRLAAPCSQRRRPFCSQNGRPSRLVPVFKFQGCSDVRPEWKRGFSCE